MRSTTDSDLEPSRLVGTVIEKIRRFDEEFCTTFFLTELSSILPTPEKVGQLNTHKTDSAEELELLHPADWFLVELIKLDHLEARVAGMKCRSTFDETFAVINMVRC